MKRRELEGIFKDQVKLFDHFRAKQMLKHITEGNIQVPLEYRQAWDINHLSMSLWSLFQCLTTLMVKKYFLMFHLNLLWHRFPPLEKKFEAFGSREKRMAFPSALPLLRKLQQAVELNLWQVMNERSIKVDKAIEHYLIFENRIVEKLRKNRPIYISIYSQFWFPNLRWFIEIQNLLCIMSTHFAFWKNINN